jgi:transposase
MPFADTEAMNENLAVIAACIAPGAHGVIVLDGAGWHSSKALVVPSNLTPITQPPFAPEVNPVENVWENLRKNNLAICIYENYDAIVDACCQAWKDLIAIPNRISSIATRQWAKVS